MLTITLHGADIDTSATAYTSVLVTTVAGLAGYVSQDFDVIGIDEAPTTTESITFASGRKAPSNFVRYSYNIKLFPTGYGERGDAIYTPTIFLRKKHVWLQANTATQDAVKNIGDTSAYHATGHCIPIVIGGIEVEHNYDKGEKNVVLIAERKFQI
jgi:hypothetical protein